MPFAFQISRFARRACMRAEGSISLQSSLEAGYRLARDTRIGEDFQILLDMRGSNWKLDTEEAMDLATAAAQIPHGHCRIALLVHERALSLARVFCDLAAAHGFQVEPFTGTEEAHRWLSIGPRVH